jgi:hypothetical protein
MFCRSSNESALCIGRLLASFFPFVCVSTWYCWCCSVVTTYRIRDRVVRVQSVTNESAAGVFFFFFLSFFLFLFSLLFAVCPFSIRNSRSTATPKCSRGNFFWRKGGIKERETNKVKSKKRYIVREREINELCCVWSQTHTHTGHRSKRGPERETQKKWEAQK